MLEKNNSTKTQETPHLLHRPPSVPLSTLAQAHQRISDAKNRILMMVSPLQNGRTVIKSWFNNHLSTDDCTVLHTGAMVRSRKVG
jgi:hypothetical protein